MRGWLRALAGGGLEMQPVAQMYVRTRLHAMAGGEGAETLLHNQNLRYHVLDIQQRERRRSLSQQQQHPQQPPQHPQQQQQAGRGRGEGGGDSDSDESVVAAVGVDNRMMLWSKHTLVPANSYRRDSLTGACDGTVCGGLCKAARAHVARDPWLLTYTHSPTEAMDDQPYNNHPLLLIRRYHSPDDNNHALFLDRLQKNLTEAIKCPPLAAPIPLPWTATVSRSFERLFGYSQRQIRGTFIEHEWLAGFLLFNREEWERLVVNDVKAEFGNVNHCSGAYSGDRGWEAQVRCIDRWGRNFDCLLVKSFEMDDQQLCTALHINLLPKRSTRNT